jgi:IS30 family transposase
MCLPVATDMKVYFSDPQSPWRRGTNENTNGLLRQYFLKRTDLSGYSQSELDKVAPRLDQSARKTLDLRRQPGDRKPLLHQRFQKLGGMTPELSKKIGM